MEAVENVLAHYGVRGMKWGVRRNRKQVASPKSEEAAKVHDILGNIHKNGIGAASNSDLQLLQNRVKLEQKFNEAFPKKKNPLVEYGKDAATRVLIPIAEQNFKKFMEKKVDAKLFPTQKVVQEVLEVGKHSPNYGRHLKR